MAYSAADKRRVYLACRAIFAGNNALLRKSKKIRELVVSHKAALAPIIRDFKVEKVLEILKILLEGQVFQSDVKAKIEFPELFRSSPTRDVQRTTSENDAARSVAEVLEEIASVEDRENVSEEGGENSEVASIQDRAAGLEHVDPSPNIPSLYPSYFPYHAQHAIICKAQFVLEECCFDFTQKWMPSVLEEHAWDCPEAVELTKWTRLFAKRATQFPPHAFKLSGAPLNDVLFSTNKLRHTAVHRLQTTCRGVKALIQAAMLLAEALQDTLRTSQLEELHFEVESKIKAMELNKNVLEDTLSKELQAIQQQREELDRRENELISQAVREDRENKALIGILLEESVNRIFEGQTARLDKQVEDDDLKSDDEEANGVLGASGPEC